MNSKTIIGGTLRSWVIISLTLLLLVSIAFVAVTYLKLAKGAKNDREWVSQATLVQVASQQLAKSASEAAAGNLEAFTELSATHSAISRAMIALIAGDPSTGTPAVPDRVLQDTSRLNATWNSVSENASSISAREELLLSVNEANSNFFAIVPKLQESADQSVRRLTESGASNQHVFAASRLLSLSDRMLRRVNEILQGGVIATSAADGVSIMIPTLISGT